MRAKVYYIDVRAKVGQNTFTRLEKLLEAGGLPELCRRRRRPLVAVKLHFGEAGCLSYVHPRLVRVCVDKVSDLGGEPFLTDTNSLYAGSRGNAVKHLHTAYKNGFNYSSQGVPVIIADGLLGQDAERVRVGARHFQTVDLACGVCQADVLLCLTHFKAHELTGIGGALKNVGMGLAARPGKLAMHSTVTPYMDEGCEGCGVCVESCPVQAIALRGPGRQAEIAAETCIGCGQCIAVCPGRHVHIRWNESVQHVQEKIVEYCYGLLKVKGLPALFVNFLLWVTPECDCYGHSDGAIVPDIGILCSADPVAIDQASADLVNRQPGLPGRRLSSGFAPGEDKFRAVYPQIDWGIQLAYAEELGLGSREYELVELPLE